MKQKTRMHTRILQKAADRCSRLFQTIRILYWRRQVHRSLREGRRLLVLIHQDCLPLGVLECVYQETELWLMIGCQVRVSTVQEKTTSDRAGLLLWCDGGRPVCRKVIRMRRVDFDNISFDISVAPFQHRKSSSNGICNNYKCS